MTAAAAAQRTGPSPGAGPGAGAGAGTGSAGAAAAVGSGCCSFQTSLGPPEYRRWRRLHGLQLPLHPQQVTGWLTLAVFMAATFGVLVPALGPALRPSVTPVLATLFAVHVASHLVALLLDPADVALRRLGLPPSLAVPEFDRSKHAHVIENGRCHLCNIRTSGPRTKHCSVCNKCVGRFDHHCKWLNHCVGGRNYAAFLVCVISAVLTSLVVVGLAIAELVLYHVQPEWLSPWTYVPYNRTVASVQSDAQFPFQDTAFLLIVSSLGMLAVVSAGLLLHLCLFHVYISAQGITTYEYIRRYRQAAAASAAAAAASANGQARPPSLGPTPSAPSLPRLPRVRFPLGRVPAARLTARSPGSAEVHSNVGTPLEAASGPGLAVRQPPPEPSPETLRRSRTVTFLEGCLKPALPTPTQPPTQPPAYRPGSLRQPSILKKSKSMNDADLEAARGIAIIQPFSTWESRADQRSAEEKVADESLCCASLRSPPRAPRPPPPPLPLLRHPPHLPHLPHPPHPEIAEFTGCECNPGRIPLGAPTTRYPRSLQKHFVKPGAQVPRRSNSLLGRLCARVTPPRRRAASANGEASPHSGARRNQVGPSNIPQVRVMSPTTKPFPAPPAPTRRRISKDLKEVLSTAPPPSAAPPPQPQPPQPVRRHVSDPVRRAALARQSRRRSSTPQSSRARSPTLSPIHESGLSNPSTPQRPRTTRQTPDSGTPPTPVDVEAEAAITDDPEDPTCPETIMYIDEDEGTFFTASMSSTNSLTPLSPGTPLSPSALQAGFPSGSWASKERPLASSPAL